MSTTATPQLQVQLIDFDSVTLVDDGKAPEVVKITEDDGFFLNTSFSDDFRLRLEVYNMLKKAQAHLPEGCFFMIYEAYRPLSRQKKLWDMATDHVKAEYPDASEKEQRDMVETFVADPFNGIGSGHQACCAIDVSLCDENGREFDMGTACQEISPLSPTLSEGVSEEAKAHRKILVEALEKEGLINYPSEWWHFSYGDHQWAYLLNKTEAIYGTFDI
jgi:D-alanyl-D-alanine dipeptidase